MKTETKISKLAIICALCTVAVSPAISAAPVRSLGGTGTYSSASSAATSKATGTSATSARAGAVRVLPSTTKAASGASVSTKPSATTTASTRVAATPRLSLGKYLAGNRVVSPSGGSSSGGGSTGGEFVGLEDWVNHLTAYRELEDTIGKLDERVIALEDKAADGVSQAELDAAIAGVQTQIDDLNTVVAALPADIVGGEELAAAIAALKSELSDAETVEGLSASVKTLQEDLLAVQGRFADYVLKADFEARSEAVDLEIEKINSAAGELIARVAKLESDTSGGVAGEQDFIDLSNAVAELEAGLDNVKAQLPADGSATATATQVQAVEEAIGVIEGLIPESGIAALDTVAAMGETVDNLSESVAALDAKVAQNVLKTEYEAKVAELDQEIADLMAGLANYYTKAEADAAIAAAVEPISGWLTADRKTNLELALINLDALIGAKEVVEEYATVNELQKVKSDLESIITGGEAGDGLVYASDLSDLDAKLVALIDANAAQDKLTSTTLTEIRTNLETGYYTSSKVDELLATKADVSELANYALGTDLESAMGLITALQDADKAMDQAVKALQDAGYVTDQTLDAKVKELAAADGVLQTAIDGLEAKIPSIEGLASETYVQGLVDALEAADVALQSAIDNIERPDVNKAYVDAAVVNLNTAIDGLKVADTNMQGAIDTINETLATLATKDELRTAKSELQAAIDKINAGDVSLTNYYTKDQADATFAKKAEVATYITEGSITTEMIESIDASKVTGQLTSSQLADGSVTPNKISTGETVLADGQLGMLVSDGAGGLRWAAIDVAM